MTDTTGVVRQVVSPLSRRTLGEVGTAGYLNTEVQYDFAVGGVPFMAKPSLELPYQRSTAQFRKQQFDSGASVGEQSLDGFWRRSQFSFHQGAGIEYFDAFTDDLVNRAFEMEGVDPWTPGKVTLGPSFASALTAAHSSALTGYDGSTTSYLWFLNTSDTKLHKWDGATDTAVSAVSCVDFAVDPNPNGRAYYAIGTTIKSSNAATVIATLSAGSWKRVWFAKQRLFALDDLGNFYAFSTAAGQTITQTTDTTRFWAGNGRVDSWALADSPSSVYMAYGRTIFRVTLSDTGAVPTLVGGITAAELPSDESVKAMRYYLGFLVIVTNKGPRVATVGSDGSVTFGPRLFDLASSTCLNVAASGSRVWLTGTRSADTHPRCFTVDLSESTGDGTYAWAVESDASLATGSYSGAATFGTSITQWDGAKIFTAGTAVSRSGFLRTGYIRLGTMEAKAFHSVRVKLDGSGSVGIILIRRGGSETTLTNIAASAGVDQDVPLNLPAPEEFVGLKFTLTADATTGDSPVLLGYQLKALPAPRRQRMVQIPLMCHDQELTSGGVPFVTPGAWTRLEALEAMEEEAGIVVVQDFRTDEQFSGFVEQVQFYNTDPPFQGEANFGGTVVVTVRKV